MRRIVFFFLVLGAASAACSNPAPPPAPSAFDRPESVSFFCWDRNAGETVALDECAPADAADGLPASPFELHGVVTQTTTGEVAAVQITGDEDHPAGPIDSDVRIPGFTFAPVGEVPSAVVTPRTNPAFTYVISRGSSSLHVIDTSSFRAGLGAMVVERPESGEPFFGRGSRPVSMELTPSEDALVVAVPELFEHVEDDPTTPEDEEAWVPGPGQVWIIPIDGLTVGEPVKIPLVDVVPPAVDLTAIPAGELPPQYELRCNLPDAETALVPPRDPVSMGTLPGPTSIVIDHELNRAIVTDTVLPVLHVIDLETQTEVETLNVGVPTRDVALTPRVPATIEDTTPTERFLYAIDDSDRSVLAIDYSDPTRASYGAVITVGDTDRLTVPFPATALDAASPAYDEAEVVRCDDPSDTHPSSLHGVFLAVATTEGRVRLFDVFDLDVTCRGAAMGCGPGSMEGVDASDQVVAIGRHRPRLATFIGSDEGVSVTEGPTWDLGATDATVSNDGTAGSSVPALEAFECPAQMGPVFPEGAGQAEGRVCAIVDPWTATSERYTFAWEGAIPFTSTTGGNFTGDDVIEVRFDPCQRGVLGSSDVPATGELAEYGGDVVAITGALPPSLDEDLRGECEALVQLTTDGESTPVLLPLVSASADAADARDTYPGRLVVGPPIGLAPGFDLAAVRRCFPELLRLEVRVSGAFLASSTRAGFRHPVVRGADGTCEVDSAAAAAGERGRAFVGERFITPDIAVRFAGSPPTAERPVLQLTVGDLPPTLSYDISRDGNTDLPSLIAEVEFNDVDDRLYVVDQARRGLIRLDLMDPTTPIEAIFR